MSFSRTLTFNTDSTITSPITLMLTMNPVTGTPSMNQVAWRVVEYGGSYQTAQASYVQNLMFCSIQVNAGDTIIAADHVALSLGQQTILNKSGRGVKFSTPTSGTAGELTAMNNTGNYQGMGVGFIDASSTPVPLLVWPSVGTTNSVDAQFTPIMSAYITSQYKQTQIIRGQIVSPVLITQNLAVDIKGDTQTYTISMTPQGAYTITPVTAAARNVPVDNDHTNECYIEEELSVAGL